MLNYRDAQAAGSDDDCPKVLPKELMEHIEASEDRVPPWQSWEVSKSDYVIDIGGEGRLALERFPTSVRNWRRWE